MQPVGKNNGKIGGHEYFKCDKNHGLLVLPVKVTVQGAPTAPVSKENPIFDGGEGDEQDTCV
jgi:dynactin complex subunit